METTKTTGTFAESMKVAEKWFNDTNSTMMDIYNKSVNLTTGFYNNMLNSVINNSKGWNTNPITDSIFKNDLTKWFPVSFSSNGNSTNFTHSFQPLVDSMYKKMIEYNQELINNFNSQFKYNDKNYDSISKEYMDTVEKRIDASMKIINSITEGYMKGLDSTIGNNKKIIEEINEQFNSVIKQNQKFWSEAIKSTEIPIEEEDKKTKESNPTIVKKQSNALVVS